MYEVRGVGRGGSGVYIVAGGQDVCLCSNVPKTAQGVRGYQEEVYVVYLVHLGCVWGVWWLARVRVV